MEFWESGLVLSGLFLTALLAAGAAIRMLPPLRSLGIPGAILGGCLGLLLGPGVLELIPLQTEMLKSVVYHGLGIVFTAVALQTPRKSEGRRSGGALSIALAIPFFLVLQALVGVVVVLLLDLHPGFGLLLSLGFEQGPGQALTMGAAWEKTGLKDGAQIGLIIAAVGFSWSIMVGVPLVIWGRRRGLNADLSQFPALSSSNDATASASSDESEGLEGLTRQMVAIGVAYLLTYGLVSTVAGLLYDAGMDGLGDTVYGFHFIVGALFGMLIRTALNRAPMASPLDDQLLSRVAGLTVDVVTCAALAAVQVEVLGENLFPILVLTTAGGVVTLVGVFWLAPRVFPNAPFEHCVLLFGTATGTLPMGLALLRILDPEMRSPASMNAVLGSAMSIPLVAVFLMVLMPFTLSGWPDSYPQTGLIAIGIFAAYALGLLVAWRVVGPLRLDSLTALWPVSDAPTTERAS